MIFRSLCYNNSQFFYAATKLKLKLEALIKCLRKWHVIPSHPGGHRQENVCSISIQVPPLAQVNASHWLSSENNNRHTSALWYWHVSNEFNISFNGRCLNNILMHEYQKALSYNMDC